MQSLRCYTGLSTAKKTTVLKLSTAQNSVTTSAHTAKTSWRLRSSENTVVREMSHSESTVLKLDFRMLHQRGPMVTALKPAF